MNGKKWAQNRQQSEHWKTAQFRMVDVSERLEAPKKAEGEEVATSLRSLDREVDATGQTVKWYLEIILKNISESRNCVHSLVWLPSKRSSPTSSSCRHFLDKHDPKAFDFVTNFSGEMIKIEGKPLNMPARMSSSALAKISDIFRKAARKVLDLVVQVSLNNYLSKHIHGKKTLSCLVFFCTANRKESIFKCKR